jgi:hypothetical protein
MYLKATPTDQRDRAKIALAMDEYERRQTSGFVAWRKTADLTDPFIHELLVRYEGEYEAACRTISETIIRSILRCARRCKVRFVSIGPNDLITFEDVRWPDRYGDWKPSGWPVAWHIANVLNIGHGAGNSHQHQVRLLGKVLPHHFGTYDLRGKIPMLIGRDLTLHQTGRGLANPYDDSKVLTSYLWQCDVRPIEPAVACDWAG